jgi:general secretion pathway protein G
MRMLSATRVAPSRPEAGFTLIEMLIVIAVVAILAGVVLTGVAGFQASARDSRRVGDLKNVQSFLELYFNKCNRYPGGLDAGGNCTTTNPANWDALKATMENGLTSKFPSPQVSTYPYYYGVSGDGLQYVIGARLERDNAVLRDDVDGTLFGIDCNDPVYCIRS